MRTRARAVERLIEILRDAEPDLVDLERTDLDNPDENQITEDDQALASRLIDALRDVEIEEARDACLTRA